MQKFQIFWITLLIGVWVSASDAFDPCQGRSSIGGQCDWNSDCAGFGVVCNNGKCACHINYQLKNDSDGSKYCVKLPDAIGMACSGQCRFPMFCNNGKCQCVRATTDGTQCYPNAKIGDSCSQNAECNLPFSACIGGRCGCVAGTSNSNGQCIGAKHCPDGSKPSGNCVRLTYDRSGIQNMFSTKGADTCPDGNYCYTSDQSLGGQCCPVTCPYNTQPDTTYSCAPGSSSACPIDTHYCHRLGGQSFSISACCRRPCRDPTPVYVSGKCYARAWLGGPCVASEQCEGGDTMQCTNGQCVCKSGFSPQSGSFITSENPPQTCVRSCSSGVSHGGECFATGSLGGQCDVDDQCPSNAKCVRGVCTCNCGGGYSKSGSSCIKVQSTTAAPGSPGVTNSGNGGIIGLLGGLVKGGGNGGGGGGGLLG